MISHNKPTVGIEEVKAISRVIDSKWIAQGEKVKEFEEAFAKLIQSKYAVAVSSGTTALHIALLSLGVKEGDEVILPTYVCSAVLNAVNYCQAKPILVDINKQDFNISFEETKKKITDRTKAIIIPHIFGCPVDILKFKTLRIPIIEDCAQAIGANINGKPIGSLGDISIFSFYATKLITTGYGGMIVSNNKELVDACRDLIDFDCRPTYKVRFNYKMSDIQAAMGLEQIKRLSSFLKRREEIAEIYDAVLIKKLDLKRQKCIAPCAKRIFYRYVIKVSENKLDCYIKELEKHRINIICPIENYELLHNYLKLDKKEYKNAEEISKTTLSLPIYPLLTDEEAKKVADCLSNLILQT